MKAWVLAGMLAAAGAGQQQPGSEDFDLPAPPDGLYPGWERVHSSRHPAYNPIRVLAEPDGNRFLRLETQGRHTALQLQRSAAWKIDPALPYRLSAAARLRGTRDNAAVASLAWLDADLQPLREDRSAPLARAEAWTPVILDVPRPPDAARFVLLRLSFEGDDVRGWADFDRLRLSPHPTLEMRPADRALPVYELGARPRVSLSALGLPVGADTLDLRLLDWEDKPAGPPLRRPLAPRRPVEVEIPVPGPGAFELEASVAGPDGFSLRRRSPLLILPPPWLSGPGDPSAYGASFAPSVTDPAALARAARIHHARLRLWERSPDPPAPARLLALARALSEIEPMTLTGVLDQPPLDLFPDLSLPVSTIVQLDRRVWEAPFRTALAPYREFVSRIQLGDRDADGVVELSAVYKPAPLTPRPEVATLAFADAADLLRRLVERAAAGPDGRIAYVPLDGPPGPALLALRAANDALSGAVPVPGLSGLLGPPLRSHVFRKNGRTLLALWSDQGSVEREFNLGDGAELCIPLGTVRRLRPGERLRVGPLPLFIGSVDPFALESQLGLQLHDPADLAAPDSTLPLRADPTTRVLRFRNLSRDQAVTGLRWRVEGPFPADWSVRPLSGSAPAVAAGESFSQELLFSVPVTETERYQDLHVELSFLRDGRERRIRRTLSLQLLPRIGLASEVAPVDGDPDARRLRLQVSNPGTRPLSILAVVRLPGQPELLEPLGPIPPGGSAGRDLAYVVRGLSRLAPDRRRAEVFLEERGGERVHLRRVIPLP